MPTRSLWCELAWLGGDRAGEGVAVDLDGDRIAAVTTGVAEAPRGATVLQGLTMPAFANAHSHAFHRVLRGRTHAARGDFWSWRNLMYDVANRLDPDSYYQLARGVYGEMARAGVGVVGEFHYVHRRPDGGSYDRPNAMADALIAAATDVGVRLTLLDTLYLHGGLSDDGYDPLGPDQQRFGDGSFDEWQTRVDQIPDRPGLRVGAAAHSVRAVDPVAIAGIAGWAEATGAPLHVHASEQQAENEQCLARHGVTPVGMLEQCGALAANTTVVHGTHVTEGDIAALAANSTACCLCPTTERDLADGIGPSDRFAAAGVSLSLGTDSHAVVDLFEEARAVELDERLRSGARGTHSPESLLQMATANGYASLGWPDGGRIAAGALADLVTVRLDSVRTAGADASSAVPTAVFAASAADVSQLIVGGRSIVVDGALGFDVEIQLSCAIEALIT